MKSIKTIDGQVRLVVGVLVLTSVLLAWLVNIAWLGLAAFVGLSLILAAFSGVCPMESFISRCPFNPKGAQA
ncbi:MAG TPA: YgaP-like transmembrane domain [Fimbriimonas sp.]|nr:YgaP-like transmembrane domain [Fimbriimonas sp.]